MKFTSYICNLQNYASMEKPIIFKDSLEHYFVCSGMHEKAWVNLSGLEIKI